MWRSDSEVHPFSAAFIKPMPGPDNIYFIYFLQVGQHQKLNYLKTASPLWGFIFLHPHIWAQVPHFRVAIIVPSCAKVKILSIHLPFFHSKCPYVTKSGAKEPKVSQLRELQSLCSGHGKKFQKIPSAFILLLTSLLGMPYRTKQRIKMNTKWEDISANGEIKSLWDIHMTRIKM